MGTPRTPYAWVLERASRDPSSPLVTDVDLSTGERVELSVSSVANGAVKAAHLVGGVTDDLGAPLRIALRVPLHWQVVTFSLGAWAAGAQLIAVDTNHLAGAADAVVLGPAESMNPPLELPDIVWGTRLHPFGLPLSPPPQFPVEDLTGASRSQPDEPRRDGGALDDAAVVVESGTITMASLLARGADLAVGLGEHGRLLTCLPLSTVDGWVAGLVLPALAERSVVLLRGHSSLDDERGALEHLCSSEQVTATAGVDVTGLPRLA